MRENLAWLTVSPTCVCRENFLVLDIFFEALNYETIEQKKAYDVAGLLGMIGVTVFRLNLNHTTFSEC